MYQHRDFECFIFLDLDGVMTSEDYIIKMHECFIKDKEDPNFHYRHFMQQYCFQEEGVEFLNKLYEKYTYAIVITSTRRYEFTPDKWNFLFQLNGIKAPVIGITSKILGNGAREDEIMKYRIDNYIDDVPFLAIDDDIFDLQEINVERKLIKVTTEKGLIPYYLPQAITSINQQKEELKNGK